jgi:hypothetical protein
MKHVGRGCFEQKQMPRCKCEEPDGKAGGLCKTCKLAVLTPYEKILYRQAYPTSAAMIDGDA